LPALQQHREKYKMLEKEEIQIGEEQAAQLETLDVAWANHQVCYWRSGWSTVDLA
jgi:hypothetical protein